MVKLDLRQIAKGLDITQLDELPGDARSVFKRVITEEEFQELQKITETSSFGYVWRKTSLGAPSGKVLAYLAKATKPARRDTDLEKRIEEILQSLGLVEHQDYVKQYPCHNFWLDFAFPILKLAIEPGATYWHNKTRDKHKNDVLMKHGWTILWYDENALRNTDKVTEEIKSAIEKLKSKYTEVMRELDD